MAAGIFDIGNTLLGSFGSTNTRGSGTKTGTTQKVLTQEGMQKLIYDVMSSDQGLAALAGGENVSGGFGSSTKTLLAQDLVTKIAGELANITAPTTTEETATTQSSTKKRPTVICTELNRQGKLSNELYSAPAASAHFDRLSYITLTGYHWWAMGVVEKMQKSERLSNLLAPWAVARYEWIVNKRRSFRGFATIYIGQPVCYLIGLFAQGSKDGYVST